MIARPPEQTPMIQIDLHGIDHSTEISQNDWETMLELAQRQGWEPTEPLVIKFQPRKTVVLPTWSRPAADELPLTARRKEAVELARFLKTALQAHRRSPPRWWARTEKGRAAKWRAFVLRIWEVIYLFGAGTVRLSAYDADQPEPLASL